MAFGVWQGFNGSNGIQPYVINGTNGATGEHRLLPAQGCCTAFQSSGGTSSSSVASMMGPSLVPPASTLAPAAGMTD